MNDNKAGPLAFSAPPLPASTSQEMLRAPASGVTVRMYRQGLGDCFLLALPTSDPNEAYYVLIDCGVLQGAPNGAANLNTVARDIQAATGGQIHLLVATHRHADHISGFELAKEVFAGITIHNLWMSWAENPADPKAQALWHSSNQALAALRRSVELEPQALAHVAGVLDFVGNQDLAAAGSDPMQPVRSLLKSGAEPEYRCPGEGPLSLPAVPGGAEADGVRLYVFGPPTSLTALGQMDPASGSNETYLAQGLPNEITAFLAAAADPASSLSEVERAARERSFPFQAGLRIPLDEARGEEFFRKHYGFEDARAGAGSSAQTSSQPAASDESAGAWRRIDQDWLSSSEQLALQLDNCINNTSLVLAIELVITGRVLLFAADAQVGNWLSWAGLPAFTLAADGGSVAIADLLQRTVMYKVGHHGSHNATGRSLADNKPWGLELMTSHELVAMLPVDEAFANEVKHWAMPWPKLYERLNELTGGRILRLDRGAPENPQPDAEWTMFMEQVAVTPRYVQYTVVG